MRTVFEAEALVEYEEAAEYAQEHFGVGRQFVAAVQAALASIEKEPHSFPACGSGHPNLWNAMKGWQEESSFMRQVEVRTKTPAVKLLSHIHASRHHNV